MKRIWSVTTGPCLVVTVEPSTIGSRSRCTPSRDTSGPIVRSRPAILSISSRKTMPVCSTLAMASRDGVIHIDQFLGFFLRQMLQRIRHFHHPFLFLPLKHAAQHVAQIALQGPPAPHVGNDADRKASFLDLHLHRSLIQLAFTQL